MKEAFVGVLEEIDRLVSIEPPLNSVLAESLWDKLDHMRSGSLPVNVIGRWLFDNSGFSAPPGELERLLNASGLITKEQFIERISVPAVYVNTEENEQVVEEREVPMVRSAKKADPSKVKKMTKALFNRLTKTHVLGRI